MKRYLVLAGALAALGLAGGCGATETDDASNRAACGAGAAAGADGHEACVYQAGIIETGFRCPAEFPYRYDVSIGVVCAAEPNLPGSVIDMIVSNANGSGAGGMGGSTGGAGGSGGEGAGGSAGGAGGSPGTGGTGGVGGTGGGAGGSCATTEALALQPGAVDLLLVVDDSGSMAPHQQALAQGFGDLLTGLAGHPWQIGVTSTDTTTHGAAGRLVPVDGSGPRILDPATPDLAAAFSSNVMLGSMGSATERGFDAAVRAVTPPLVDSADDAATAEPADGNLGFLRGDSHLAIIFVGDEDDQSNATVADTHAALLLARGGNADLLSAHAIVPIGGCPTQPTPRFQALATLTGGLTLDLCPPLAGAMATLGADIAQRAPTDRWGAAATPADVDGDGAITDADVIIRVNGTAVPSSDPGGDTIWQFDAAANAVVFAPGHIPAAGDTVELQTGCTP